MGAFADSYRAEPATLPAAQPLTDAAQPPQPQESGAPDEPAIEAVVEGEPDVIEALGSNLAAVANGGVEAANSVLGSAREGVNAIKAGINAVAGTELETPEYAPIEKPFPDDYATVAGAFVEGFTEFVAVQAGASRAFRAAGMTGTVLRDRLARPMVSGGAADWTVFEESQGNLTRLIEDHFGDQAPALVTFLSTDPDDAAWEARAKAVVEGAVLGLGTEAGLAALGKTKVAADTLFAWLKGTRDISAARDAGDEAGAVAAMEGLQQANESIDALLRGEPTTEHEELLAAYVGRARGSAGEEAIEATPQQAEYFKNFVDRIADPDAAPAVDTELAAIGAEMRAKMQAAGMEAGNATYTTTLMRLGVVDADRPRWAAFAQTMGMSDEQLRLFHQHFVGAVTTGKNLDDVFEGIGFNTAHWSDTDAAPHLAWTLLSDMFEAQMDTTVWRGVTTHRATKELASLLGTKPRELFADVHSEAGRSWQWPARVVAGKALLQGMLKRTVTLSQGVMAGTHSEDAALAHIAATLNYAESMKTIISNHARALNAGNIDVEKLGGPAMGSVSKMVRELAAIPNETGARRKVFERLAHVEDPSWAMKILKAINASKAWDVANEVWINSILSGPLTHAVNIASNAVTGFALAPVENMVGRVLTGDLKGAKAAFASYGAMRQSMSDAMELATQAFREEQNILDKGHRVLDVAEDQRAVRAETFGVDPFTRLGQFLDGSGEVLRLPGRMLLSADEFFKQAAYRQKVAELAYGEGFARGLDGDDMNTYIADRMRNAFDDVGEATDKDALRYAQEVTFTEALYRGDGNATMSRAPALVQDFVVKVKPARMVVPFVRTPTNIMVGAVQRMPGLGLVSKKLREDFASGDPMRRASAVGKQAVGSAVMANLMYLAAEGSITGVGPADANVRKQWEMQGWKPESIKIGDTWYSYKRIEPFATLLGLAGNLAEVHNELTDEQYNAAADAALTGVIGMLSGTANSEGAGRVAGRMVRQFTDKTFVRGIKDFTDAMASGDANKVAAYGRIRAGTIVPFSSFMGQTSADPYVREAYTVVEGLRSKVWWAQEGLAKRYDVLGRPLVKTPEAWADRAFNPAPSSPRSEDPLMKAFAGLDQPIGSIPKRKGNVDLLAFENRYGTTAYERYNQLVGEVKLGGKTLEEELRSVVTHPSWSDMSEGFKSEGAGVTYVGSRVERIRQVVSLWREVAYDKLTKEGFRSESGLALGQASRNDRENAARAKSTQTEFTDLLPVK